LLDSLLQESQSSVNTNVLKSLDKCSANKLQIDATLRKNSGIKYQKNFENVS